MREVLVHIQKPICVKCGKERSVNKRNTTGLCRACNWRTVDYSSTNYSTIHRYLTNMFGKGVVCMNCGDTPPRTKNNRSRIHWANITGVYDHDPKNYKELCISCHHKLDNKIDNIKWMRTL